VYHATALTYRNQAILPVVIAGEPVEEDHTAQGIPSAAELLYQMREAKIPVTMVCTTLESAQHCLVVTLPRNCRSQSASTGEALCRRIGEQVFEKSKFGAVIPKILVMNDDIDATNLREVVWAFATRCHPFKGEIHFNKEATSPLVAFLETAEKTTGITTKVVYNCLPPEEWGDRLPGRTAFQWNYPRELQEQVIANWGAYGFGKGNARKSRVEPARLACYSLGVSQCVMASSSWWSLPVKKWSAAGSTTKRFSPGSDSTSASNL